MTVMYVKLGETVSSHFQKEFVKDSPPKKIKYLSLLIK
jgi:hypothetical protein